jgi:phosphate transport system protein
MIIRSLEEIQRMLRAEDGRGLRFLVQLNDSIRKEGIKVEEECLKIQALYQPTGKELRTVTAHLKMNQCLERISCHILHVSYLLKDLQSGSDHCFSPELCELARRTTYLTQKSLQALMEEDLVEAKAVCIGDPLAEELQKLLYEQHLSSLLNGEIPPAEGTKLYRLILEFEYIEEMLRCIAGDTVYLINGETLRPQPVGLVKSFETSSAEDKDFLKNLPKENTDYTSSK